MRSKMINSTIRSLTGSYLRRAICPLAVTVLCSATLSGCSTEPEPSDDPGHNISEDNGEEEVERYKIDYCGSKDSFTRAKDSYKAGQTVTLYYDMIATDTDYTFYLDDEILNVNYSEDKGYIIKFTMPDHDVTLRVESRNTMEAPLVLTDDLMEKLFAESGCSEDDVTCYIQDDFDGDGYEELFAIIGEITDEDWDAVTGSTWFVSDSECTQLYDSFGLGTKNDIRSMTIGDITYVIFDGLFISESYSCVYYVSDGNVYETAFSRKGYVAADKKDHDRFTVSDSSYDMCFDKETGSMIGHTWKNYYFFYDSADDCIYEYAGTTIDMATVEYWCGEDFFAELLSDDDVIDNIFMRGNGLIVINLENTDDSGNINYYHYIYSTSKESFVDDTGTETDAEPLSGIYYSSLIPDMANYPQVPGPDDMVWYGE
ncbi:MAG: hypothetical protein K6B69_13540 [Lachnospiraceae bacterium]|nr:hypothetical protein [Lachnospiraceae bacterium]